MQTGRAPQPKVPRTPGLAHKPLWSSMLDAGVDIGEVAAAFMGRNAALGTRTRRRRHRPARRQVAAVEASTAIGIVGRRAVVALAASGGAQRHRLYVLQTQVALEDTVVLETGGGGVAAPAAKRGTRKKQAAAPRAGRGSARRSGPRSPLRRSGGNGYHRGQVSPQGASSTATAGRSGG